MRRLTLEFREDGSDSTELILVHDHLGAAHPVTNVNRGWTAVTDRLVKYLEETEGEAR
ncbi:MAG: SRPBCC domain-containing protein [Thermoleophilia bacterium]|nr:SRPBCC domain-containing protein [Thermoleophilia bacterium]